MGTRNTSLYGIAALAAALVTTSAYAQGGKKGAAPAAPAPAPAVSAPSAPVAPGAKKEDGKVDISDLENKYWAPKDTDFSVVQNRTYTKDGRWFLTGHLGNPINDQWSEGNIYGFSLNHFITERWGIQATYLKGALRDNQAVNDVATYGSGIKPDHGRFSGYYGLGMNVVPFYAKMSFWGKKIIYFDMAFTPTIGMTNYDQVMEDGTRSKSSLTYGIDVTQYFFFTNYFAIRADLKNQWHSEEIVRFRGNTPGKLKGDKVKDKNVQDTQFLLGLTFFY